MKDKDETLKFRLNSGDKAAIKRAAKLANIPVSVLVRLCLTSQHSLSTDPVTLRKTAQTRKK